MKYLLDTNICVFVIRAKSKQVVQRLQQYGIGDLGISVVTLAELVYGAEKSKDPPKNHAALQAFLISFEIVEWDAKAAIVYGKVRTDLEKQGLPIGPLDTLIAAHALSLNVPLVTNNTGEFSRVKNLILEDWTNP